MKTLVIALLFALTAMGQTEEKSDYLAADQKQEKVMLFYTNVPDGLDNDVQLKLYVSKEDLKLMKDTRVYRYWTEERGGTEIELFLKWLVIKASIETMYALNQTLSYKPLSKDEATGIIMIYKDEKVGVNFKLKAQNGYGNYVFGDSMYSINITKKGEENVFQHTNF
ncbi:MAG: hypothetical protein ACQEWG_06115 [Bacteroidota bacterium]